jgi:transaldolase
MPQRLLFASTGTKDPAASDCLYVDRLAAPSTINTMPEKTLLAFADRGRVAGTLSAGGGMADATVFAIERAGVSVAALGEKLQKDGAAAFVTSWDELLGVIAAKSRSVGSGG